MYLLACSIVMVFALIPAGNALAGFVRAVAERNPLRRALVGRGVLVWSSLVVFACFATAPFLAGLIDLVRLRSGDALIRGDGSLSLWLGIYGATATIVFYATRWMLWLRQQRVPGFVDTGRVVLPVFSAALILYANIDQILFNLHDGVGVASGDIVQSATHDANCDHRLALIYWDEQPTSPVIYRCPLDIVMNPFALVPFMPWPGYIEGSSLELAKVMNGARHTAAAADRTSSGTPSIAPPIAPPPASAGATDERRETLTRFR